MINVPTAYCNDMTWTGVTNNPSIDGTYPNVLKLYGSLALAAGMAFNFNNTISFEATTTGKTITSAGNSFGFASLAFNGIGGGWTLQDALTTASYILLNNGTLNTNSQTVNADAFFSYSNSPRTLTLGASVINLSDAYSTWEILFSSLMTLNSGTSTINCTATSSDVYFSGGGLIYHNLAFSASGSIYDNNTFYDVTFAHNGTISGSGTFHDVTFSGDAYVYGSNTFNNVTIVQNGNLSSSNTFNNLTFSPGYTYTLGAGQTQSVTNLCATGTGSLPIRIQSGSVGTQTTISKASGTMCWDYVRISDLNATGGAAFDAGIAPVHSEDLGNNTGFVFAGACTPVSCTPCNPPLITAQPANSTVCAGSNSAFTVGATGDGIVYQWQGNTGSGFTNLTDMAPYSGTESNTLQVTNATNGLNGYLYRCVVSGCSPADTSNSAVLTVNALPAVTVNSATVCAGQTATLTASGATTYSWNTGATTNSVTVNPVTTTSYTVTGTTNSCSATAVSTVTLNPLPTVNVNSATILSGQSATLTATGASSYSWSTGETTSAITVSPVATTSYTVTGTSTGCSNTAIATVTVTTQTATVYRSRQNGNWNSASTWQISTDNTTWNNATQAPNYTNVSTITIQSGHTVTLNTAVTVDELVINGTLVYPNNAGIALTINNGTGTDLTINGMFRDERTMAIAWASNATWIMGSTGTLIRTTNTSATNWNTRYEGGINNIPATANWIIRKTGANNPPLTATAGMHYPNLIIENNTSGTWATVAGSSITGSAAPPIIKGDLNVGGNGTSNVSFLNSNTNAIPVFVGGNLIVKTGSTLRSQGTGFEVQGNLVLNGTVNYANSNTTFVFTGSQNQTISGAGTIPFRNLQLNKLTTTATITLLNPATVSGTVVFTNGYFNTTNTNVLTFTNGSVATGANANSFISGPVRKTGNSAFVFPTGKNGNYQPIAISAPVSAAATYAAEYFHQDAALGTNKDASIDSVSNCEYWTLNNVGIAYPVRVTVGWNNQSCRVATVQDGMRLTRWNGTRWLDLGNNSTTTGTVTSTTTVNAFGIFTLAQALPPCMSAVQFPSDSISTTPTIAQTATSKWYKFQSLFNTIKIDLTSLSNNTTDVARKIILWEGNCNNLTYILSDSISTATDSILMIISTSLIPGTNYYLEVIKSNNSTAILYTLNKKKNIQSIPCNSNPLDCPTSSLVSNPCDLICNGGFEAGITPTHISEMDFACGWDRGSNASPDYFRTDATSTAVSIPLNDFGNQSAHSGSTYAGFFAHAKTIEITNGQVTNDYHEYIYQKLRYPLIAGVTYYVSFWVSRADHTAKASNTIGAYLSVNDPYLYGKELMPVSPQISCYPTVISNANNWTQIRGSFIANGGENYIVIGDFGSYSNVTSPWHSGTLFNAPLTPPLLSNSGTTIDPIYYYLDDVSITPIPYTVTATPNTICMGGATTLQAVASPINGCINVAPNNPNVTWSSVPASTFSPVIGSTTFAVPTTPGNVLFQSSITYNPGCTQYQSTTVTVNPSNCCLPNMITLTGNISNYTGSNTNQNFNVTGTLIINQNYTFAGCNIIMAPNAVIQVNSGRTLNITNKTHIYACTTMWDRITVQNNATLNILNNSLIEDGTRAVYIANGGHVVARNVIFNKNLRAIELAANNAMVSPVALTASVITSRNITFFSNTTQNPTAAAVWANIISQNPTYLPATIKAPYSCVKGNYGVYATNVRTLTIGATAAGFNGFDEILCGIFITSNSGSPATTIYNNKFRNIKGYFLPSCLLSAPFVSEEGYGIRAFSSSTGAPVITVGGTGANQTNDFYNIYSGIKVEGYKNVNVIKNTFDNSITGPFLFGGQINYGNAAVSVFNPLIQNTINASQNNIKNCASGIFVNRLTNASCTSQAITLSNNTITSNGTNTGYCVNGISIQNGTNSTATPYDAIKIQQNTITQVQHCITASNVKRGLLISLNPNLGIAYDATAQRNGIRLLSCEDAKVLNNCYIHSMQTNTYTRGNADMRGIYVYNTRGVQVQCNQVWDVTKGMLFEANCVSSTLLTSVRYNKLNNAYYGLYMLNSAQIGTQGSAFPPTASENYWFGNYTWQTYVNNVTNVNTASRFYVRNASAFTIPTNHGFLLGSFPYNNSSGFISITAPAYGACTCASAIAPPDEPPVIASMEVQTATVAALVEDTVSTDVFAESVKWQNQKFAYQKIDDNISIATGNSVLTNFYVTANHNIKQLSRVEKYLFNYNAAFAHAINGGIQPHGVMEENQQRVNELLLLKEINTNYIYSEIQIEDAYNIAVQCPITGGDAVIQARALYSYMIGSLTEFEDECSGATQRSMIVNEADEENKNNIRLYPNPNGGSMTLEYQLNEKEEGLFIIYDITGKQLQSYSFNSESSQIAINASLLNAGMYLYDVFINNVKVKTDRIVIVK